MGRPCGIVLATATADVVAAVRLCAVQGIELSIASARKSHLCVLDDALMVDISSMKKILINSAEGVATVEAGVTWRVAFTLSCYALSARC